MPITAAVDHQKGIFRTTVSGAVTMDDLARHVNAVRRMAAYRYPGLVDARAVERLLFERRDLIRFVHYMKGILSAGTPAPRAIVVGNLGHLALARLVASLVIGWMHVAVFEDPEGAEDWLASWPPKDLPKQA